MSLLFVQNSYHNFYLEHFNRENIRVPDSNTECRSQELRTNGYTLSQNSKYNEKLEVLQFLASSNGQTLGTISGSPGDCTFTMTPRAEVARCEVAKELLKRCINHAIVISQGPIDIKHYISLHRVLKFDEELVESSTNVGNALCEVMVHVNCPFQHPNDKDAQKLVDDACLTFFATAREAGYNYGFFFVSL